MNGSSPYENERVAHTPNPAVEQQRQHHYIPQVMSAVGSKARAFEPEDMSRVMDFEGVQEPPTDGGLMHCEDEVVSDQQQHQQSGIPRFPVRHFCLRGGFLFYFAMDDVDDQSGPYVTYLCPPLGVIPLDHVIVEFPPGGRRVFREHAQSEARSGYELVILHNPTDRDTIIDETMGGDGGILGSSIRPPAYLVAEGLAQREKWAAAIRARSSSKKPTILRAGYTPTRATTTTSAPATAAAAAQAQQAGSSTNNNAAAPAATSSSTTTNNNNNNNNSSWTKNDTTAGSKSGPVTSSPTKSTTKSTFGRSGGLNSTSSKHTKNREKKSIEKQVMAVSDDIELASAVVEFGVSNFNEIDWMNYFFQIHSDVDSYEKCNQMELFQIEMKKSLKGAVLEQYEYFVQASGEMTTMGKEISSLRMQVEQQLVMIKLMKEIDFTSALRDNIDDEMLLNRIEDASAAHESTRKYGADPTNNNNKGAMDDLSEISETGSTPAHMGGGRSQHHHHHHQDDIFLGDDDGDETIWITVPDWLDDCCEEVVATLRECRYNDATELYTKAKTEVTDLLDKHDRPTAYRLSRRNLSHVKDIQKSLDKVGKRICYRLVESLRRKNEALRQSAKRERADNTGGSSSGSGSGISSSCLISPCALNDDALYLQLLVRIGRTQEAAEAYTARRSLLLLETLHERPISGAGTVDLVIYAAQVSQSFFSCLATSVEGFMDLFLLPPAKDGSNNEKTSAGEDISLDASSLHSLTSKNIPAGAIASIVLWCDSELAKYASAFGGTRILANLALSPPTRDSSSSSYHGTGRGSQRLVGGSGGGMGGGGGISTIKNGNGTIDDSLSSSSTTNKERKNAIEVAAQCIDQAFMYATQNLDSVGLPLTPRLAEYIRIRLKGCENEVSYLLEERWQYLTQDWRQQQIDGNHQQQQQQQQQNHHHHHVNGM